MYEKPIFLSRARKVAAARIPLGISVNAVPPY